MMLAGSGQNLARCWQDLVRICPDSGEIWQGSGQILASIRPDPGKMVPIYITIRDLRWQDLAKIWPGSGQNMARIWPGSENGKNGKWEMKHGNIKIAQKEIIGKSNISAAWPE